jgi:hypothetical protein
MFRECLEYKDGKLFWKHRPLKHFKTEVAYKTWNKKYADKEAGSLHNRYFRLWALKISEKNYIRSTIVWLFHHDEWVSYFIHKNDDPLDDRIENLQPTTISKLISLSYENRSEDKNKIIGIYYVPNRRKYYAEITIKRTRISLGYFKYKKDAEKARKAAERKYFGELVSK